MTHPDCPIDGAGCACGAEAGEACHRIREPYAMRAGALTDTQKMALLWLYGQGGDGVFTGRGIQGQLLARGETSPFNRATYEALSALNGAVEVYHRDVGRLGNGRCRVTPAGALIAGELEGDSRIVSSLADRVALHDWQCSSDAL